MRQGVQLCTVRQPRYPKRTSSSYRSDLHRSPVVGSQVVAGGTKRSLHSKVCVSILARRGESSRKRCESTCTVSCIKY